MGLRRAGVELGLQRCRQGRRGSWGWEGVGINLVFPTTPFIFTGCGDLGHLLLPWGLAQVSVHHALIIPS